MKHTLPQRCLLHWMVTQVSKGYGTKHPAYHLTILGGHGEGQSTTVAWYRFATPFLFSGHRRGHVEIKRVAYRYQATVQSTPISTNLNSASPAECSPQIISQGYTKSRLKGYMGIYKIAIYIILYCYCVSVSWTQNQFFTIVKRYLHVDPVSLCSPSDILWDSASLTKARGSDIYEVRDLFPWEMLTKMVISCLLNVEKIWNSAQINLSSTLNIYQRYVFDATISTEKLTSEIDADSAQNDM